MTCGGVQQNGTLEERKSGSPQGSVILPLLSNIVLHHVFDSWLAKSFPDVPFTRYADDALVHCETQKQANCMRDMIVRRFSKHMLKVHPQKMKIVYRKKDDHGCCDTNTEKCKSACAYWVGPEGLAPDEKQYQECISCCHGKGEACKRSNEPKFPGSHWKNCIDALWERGEPGSGQ